MLGTLNNENNIGLWITGITAHGKLKKHDFGTGKTNVYGGQIEIDCKFKENLIFGTTLSYSKSDVKFDRYRVKAEADGFGVSLYGRLKNNRVPHYIQGRIGIGFITGNVQRDILLETFENQRGKKSIEIKHFLFIRKRDMILKTEISYLLLLQELFMTV